MELSEAKKRGYKYWTVEGSFLNDKTRLSLHHTYPSNHAYICLFVEYITYEVAAM
jgi:hypothetical protein